MTGDLARFLFTAKDNRGFPGEFDYYEGPDHHVFLGNLPDSLACHYAGGYQRIPGSKDELASLAKGDAYRLDQVRALVPSGDFLEIGCWIGLVSYSAKLFGYSVSAFEINAECVALLRSVGIDAVQTADPATALEASGKKYDVIGIWHAIEHVPRPWTTVEVACGALRPGGVLIICAPNPESAQMRAFGKHWVHLDAPRHLHLISAGTYENIGLRCGLVTVQKTSDDKLARILDRDGWRFEARRRVRNIPVIRALADLLMSSFLERKYRRDFNCERAGFTLIMQRPPT